MTERGPASSPLFGAFFEAVQQAGYPLTDDVNGYRQEGFAPFDRNVHRGRRLSAARAYLHPVMNRPNLTVHTLSHVTGLRMRGNRVVGVDYLRGGKFKQDSLKSGGFGVVVSGISKGCGSSRETAPYSELKAGVQLVIAASADEHEEPGGRHVLRLPAARVPQRQPREAAVGRGLEHRPAEVHVSPGGDVFRRLGAAVRLQPVERQGALPRDAHRLRDRQLLLAGHPLADGFLLVDVGLEGPDLGVVPRGRRVLRLRHGGDLLGHLAALGLPLEPGRFGVALGGVGLERCDDGVATVESGKAVSDGQSVLRQHR